MFFGYNCFTPNAIVNAVEIRSLYFFKVYPFTEIVRELVYYYCKRMNSTCAYLFQKPLSTSCVTSRLIVPEQLEVFPLYYNICLKQFGFDSVDEMLSLRYLKK